MILWPPIQSFWAEAAARGGDARAFSYEVEALAGLEARSGARFWEIYNSTTGALDGGWQVGHPWYSEPDQTWSATGYLRMIYAGLFGLRFGVDGLTFAPLLPAGWGDVSLTGLHYRKAVLRIALHGAGDAVRSFRLDGLLQPGPEVPADLKGAHRIDIEMGEHT